MQISAAFSHRFLFSVIFQGSITFLRGLACHTHTRLQPSAELASSNKRIYRAAACFLSSTRAHPSEQMSLSVFVTSEMIRTYVRKTWLT